MAWVVWFLNYIVRSEKKKRIYLSTSGVAKGSYNSSL